MQQKKETGEISQQEGKSALSVNAYSHLCRATLQATTDFGMNIFMHAFLILSWTLLNRPVSTATINYANFSFAGDCIFVNQPRSKSDRSGERVYSRSLFANPKQPEVCPFLALALQVFSASDFTGQCSEQGSPMLFGRHGAEQRFSEALAKIMKNEVLAHLLGPAGAQDIGTHSIRKGSMSFLAAQMEGPSASAVFQRAGCSMGAQDGYLFSSGADQFAGRFCSLLNPLADDFGALPPHFDNHEAPFPPGHSWQTTLPNHASLPKSFLPVLPVLPVLLASLVYHYEWLRKTLVTNHAFFKSQVVVSGLLNELQQLNVVQAGTFVNEKTHMRASGVPPSFITRWNVGILEKKLAP